jgi:ApaG protein
VSAHPRGTAVEVELTTTALSASDLGQQPGGDHGVPFAYRVGVRNIGNRTVQLLARTWSFEDDRGGVIVVPRWSPGVVGERPVLQPLQSFSYVSGVELRTARGKMSGALRFLVPSDGDFVEAAVAETVLATPQALR